MQVVLPFLAELGDRWEEGRLSVAHEHFVEQPAAPLAVGLHRPPAQRATTTDGPVVLLACPPGERHDLVLLCFSLLLGENGARTRFLGADTPMPAIVAAARACQRRRGRASRRPATPRSTAEAAAISRLAVEHPVFVAGRGATAGRGRAARAPTTCPTTPSRPCTSSGRCWRAERAGRGPQR